MISETVHADQLLRQATLRSWVEVTTEPDGKVVVLGMYQAIIYDKNGQMVSIRTDTTGVRLIA